jgi:S1-C subfamily serine protease
VAMASSNRPPLLSCSPWALLVVIALVAFYFAWQFLAPMVKSVNDPRSEPRLVTPRGDLAQDEQSTIELFRSASPSVVHIVTWERRLARERFRLRAVEIPQGSGSGFIWDERGYIVTNYHVIQGATRALVTLDDRSQAEASLVGADPDYDVAVLKIESPRSKLTPVAIGSSDDLLVGQKVFAIGNPFGLDHTLTTGIISGIDREISSVSGVAIRGVIQTDAAINPGNSGGPLLDSAGRLIGMNTAIAGVTGANVGVGFAVPVASINRVVPALIRYGRWEPPKLGVRFASSQVATMVGIPGLVVETVYPETAAERAGLRSLEFAPDDSVRADVITKIDGRAVRTPDDVHEILGEHRPGDKLKLDVVRDGQAIVVPLTLQDG